MTRWPGSSVLFAMSGAPMETEPTPTAPVMDVEAYASQYSGRVKLARLWFVATHAPPGSPLELDALRLAVEAAKQGVDTAMYTQVCRSPVATLQALSPSW